jgi:hypothetical protein
VAEVQIVKIQFTANNPQGGFVAGDVLDVYVETDNIVTPAPFNTDGVYAKKNGVLMTSDIGFVNTAEGSYKTVTYYNPQICKGTSLVVPFQWWAFPYGAYVSYENHNSCTIDPPTCDLIVVGSPVVTPASGSTESDGSIEVTASSTNTIEYRLNNDFVYGDGTGQSDGLFSGLLPGEYRVYMRDSVNCGISVIVTVNFTNEYGVKFRMDYDDFIGGKTRVDIVKRGYTGDITETCGQGEPFTIDLRGEGSTDKFESVLSSTASINLLSDVDLKFLEIYTNDPELYRALYYKDTGSGFNLLWTGKILPNLYEEDYKAPPYYVNTTAIDGLSNLKDFYLIQDDGQKLYGTTKLIKLIAYCLNKIKIPLTIRVACNLYANGMAITDSDDPLDQAYCDYEAFYINNEQPDLLFVLKKILEPFGARLVQWENRWNIVRVEEMAFSSYDYRDFNSDGDYVSEGSYAPIKNLGYPRDEEDLIWIKRDQFLSIQHGYGSMTAIYRLGLKPNILKNGDFRLIAEYNPFYNTYVYRVNTDGFNLVNAGYAITESYEKLEDSNIAYAITGGAGTTGEAYIQSASYLVKMGSNNQLKFSIRLKIPVTSSTFGSSQYTFGGPYIKLRIRIKYGSLYLQGNGSWSADENILVFHVSDYNKYVEFDILANQPSAGDPVGGMDFDVRIYHAYPYHAEFTSLANLKAAQTVDSGDPVLPNGYKTEMVDSSYPLKFFYYELEDNSQTPNDYDIVRPNDYNGVNNARQWILKFINNEFDSIASYGMYIDRVSVQFLTSGKEPIDTIVREQKGENNNKIFLEKELILGSYQNLITTDTRYAFDLGYQLGTGLYSIGQLVQITENILSADLIYTGYLRDADGNGYENWKRDGIAESNKLHGILLKSYASQYKKSWRKMTGSFYSKETYFGLLNVIREINANNRIYLPISLRISDKENRYQGEFLELIDIFDSAGSDGSGEAPFSSGFTIGFGSTGFD